MVEQIQLVAEPHRKQAGEGVVADRDPCPCVTVWDRDFVGSSCLREQSLIGYGVEKNEILSFPANQIDEHVALVGCDERLSESVSPVDGVAQRCEPMRFGRLELFQGIVCASQVSKQRSARMRNVGRSESVESLQDIRGVHRCSFARSTLFDRGSRNVVPGEQIDKSAVRTPRAVTPRVRAEHRITTPGVSSTVRNGHHIISVTPRP